ncbi:MAG: TenA family protein [Candidatus Dormibacteria bacterium]
MTSPRNAASGAASLWLKDRAGPAWTAATRQRFVRDVTNNRLTRDVFQRYLLIEVGFIDTAAKALGMAIRKAPSYAERRYLARGLYELTTEQYDYFVSAFRLLGMDLPGPRAPSSAGIAGLHRHFLSVANNGTYQEIIACFLAAEWLYLTWCTKAAQAEISNPMLREWIVLHTSREFADHVGWLRSEIDRLGVPRTDCMAARVVAAFDGALRLEIGFHNAAYVEAAGAS